MSSSTHRHFGLELSALSALGTFIAALALGSPAHAQSGGDPDLRNIEPLMMIIVDTSGSMERKAGCTCITSGCTECLPNCPTSDTPAMGDEPVKNRWAYTLEALTGSFSEFRCNSVLRTEANGATYDIGYPLDYHQPWHCPAAALVCAPPATILVGATTTDLQDNDGVLDAYISQYRFGLMTFDGVDTYTGSNPLIHQSAFSTTLSEAIDGMWSYAGPHTFHYPNCTEDYMIDSGSRSPIATEGALISVNSTVCTTPPCDTYQINAAVQSALLRSRPFGGTPTAAALDDLYYHLKSELSDTFGGCRDKFAMLITDGPPNDDYRLYGCDCNEKMNCPPDEDATLMHCPYPTAAQVAKDLVTGRGTDQPQLTQLSVVGIGIAAGDTALRATLNAIAREGGSVATAPSTDEAIFVDDTSASLDALSAALGQVLGDFITPLSRSVPAFAANGVTGGQYQISTGFKKGTGALINDVPPPWTGVIERHRIECNDQFEPETKALDESQGDDFSKWLNDSTGDMANRRLWTALPATGGPQFTGHLSRATIGAACGALSSSYCTETQVKDLTAEQLFGTPRATDTTARTLVVDWMYGNGGSVRAGKRLGDVYHSSPVIPRLPYQSDGSDESYTMFLDRAEVRHRPLVMYVGTNDGILHAFSVEDYDAEDEGNIAAYNSVVLVPGQELWGFVPPMVLPGLEAQVYSHQFGIDGVPFVKDVFFHKGTGPNANDYHTVLITGMRRGGNGYIALDVSDPLDPKFLWQFAKTEMGYTYGKPVIMQAEFLWDDGSGGAATVQRRAVAVLPGGSGIKGEAADCGGSVTTPAFRDPTTSAPYTTFAAVSGTNATTPLLHRADVRCWKGKDPVNPLLHAAGNGRALYFVDVETGKLIKELRLEGTGSTAKYVFPSPLVGSPTVHPDQVGAIATEGFITDADGVIWRIDVSSTTPGDNDDPRDGWTVRPFHDMFWDGVPTDGAPTYELPILSVDEQKRLIVITGTGDTDNFDQPTAQNRVVSLTQVETANSGPDKYKAAFNWEHRVKGAGGVGLGLVTSEMVTGTMALFEGRLYYATFISVVSGTNACDLGRGRLWSVDYHLYDAAAPNTNAAVPTYGPKMIDLTAEEIAATSDDTDSGASYFNVDVAGAADNLMVFGLGATQPSCTQSEAPYSDAYFSSALPKFTRTAPPSIWLVAQASRGRGGGNRNLGKMRVQLTRGQSFAKIGSWAPSVD